MKFRHLRKFKVKIKEVEDKGTSIIPCTSRQGFGSQKPLAFPQNALLEGIWSLLALLEIKLQLASSASFLFPVMVVLVRYGLLDQEPGFELMIVESGGGGINDRAGEYHTSRRISYSQTLNRTSASAENKTICKTSVILVLNCENRTLMGAYSQKPWAIERELFFLSCCNNKLIKIAWYIWKVKK